MGSCSGSGSTFIATSLAFVAGQHREGITYLEGGGHDGEHSLPFYELSLDKHISPRRFVDFFKEKEEGRLTNNRVNLYRNVNWVVRITNSTAIITPGEVAGEYIVWDKPSELRNSDLIICVVDSLPCRVIAGKKIVDICRENYADKTLWLFNRTDTQREAKDAEKFLKVKGDFYVPAQPWEDFRKAQNLFTSIMDSGNQNNILAPKPLPKLKAVMEELAQYILTLY